MSSTNTCGVLIQIPWDYKFFHILFHGNILWCIRTYSKSIDPYPVLPSTAIGADGYCRRCMSAPVRPSVPLSISQSVPNNVTALNLWFQLLAWNLVEWCTVLWSRSLFKMVMCSQFLCASQNFEIFLDRLGPGLRYDDSVMKCQEITLWPEIWRYDALYNEPDRNLKLPRPANVCIFWSRPAEGSLNVLLD